MDQGNTIRKEVFVLVIILLSSKAVAFFREIIIANYYGASYEVDAFYFANDLVLNIFSIVAASLATAFVPIYLNIKIQSGAAEAKAFADKLLSYIFLISLPIVVIMAVFSNSLIDFLAIGFNAETVSLAASMLRVLLPIIFLYGIINLKKGILHAHKKFYIVEASGIPYSISIILFTIILYKEIDIYALLFAAVFGVTFQALMLTLSSLKIYKFALPKSLKLDSNTKAFLLMIFPIALGTGTQQISNLVTKIIASSFDAGSIASLNYSQTIINIINGIFVYSITTVIFPRLAEKVSSKLDIDRSSDIVIETLSAITVLLVPIVAVCTINNQEIISVIYERGAFTSSNTEVVGRLFSIYVVGCLTFGWREVLRKTFYANMNSKTPMINAAITVPLNIILAYYLSKSFGVYGLAMGSVLSIAIMTPVLFVKLKLENKGIVFSNFFAEVAKSLSAICISLVVNHIAFQTLNVVPYISRIIISTIIIVSAYIAMLMALSSSTLNSIIFKKK